MHSFVIDPRTKDGELHSKAHEAFLSQANGTLMGLGQGNTEVIFPVHPANPTLIGRVNEYGEPDSDTKTIVYQFLTFSR
jgi:hypothetical protein